MALEQLSERTLVRDSAVVVLYVRDDSEEVTRLDIQVAAIVERYKPFVVLQVVTPEELPEDVSGGVAPRLLVMRDGELVGQAMGALLPAREIDRVVRCAVEWPT
jgi:hypothetical protein